MKTSEHVRGEFILVTPAMAKEWLKKNTKQNRSIRRYVRQKYLSSMAAGQWQECNGETIKFDRDGNLIDGQHRLEALIEFGKPLWFLVAYNCCSKAFATIDTGSNRRACDMLSIRGSHNCTALAAALTLLSRYENKKMQAAGRHVSNVEVLELEENHPDMEKSVDLAQSHTGPKGFIRGSIMAFVHYLGSRKHGEAKATEFLLAVCRDEPSSNDQPIRLLRRRLINNLASAGKLTKVDLAALVIKSWNLFVAGNTAAECGCLSWKSKVEDFPELM